MCPRTRRLRTDESSRRPDGRPARRAALPETRRCTPRSESTRPFRLWDSATSRTSEIGLGNDFSGGGKHRAATGAGGRKDRRTRYVAAVAFGNADFPPADHAISEIAALSRKLSPRVRRPHAPAGRSTTGPRERTRRQMPGTAPAKRFNRRSGRRSNRDAAGPAARPARPVRGPTVRRGSPAGRARSADAVPPAPGRSGRSRRSAGVCR